MDAYEIYCQWWKDHYGYDFPVDRAMWNKWCKLTQSKPCDSNFDIETERREGWTYDDTV